MARAREFTMAVTPYHVAEAFRLGKADSAGAFRSDGTALFSYRMLLAVHLKDGTIELHHDARNHGQTRQSFCSVTTARHCRALFAVLNWSGAHPGVIEGSTPWGHRSKCPGLKG